jgi:hypothetical protein
MEEYQEHAYQVILNLFRFVFYGFCAVGMLSFDAHAHGIWRGGSMIADALPLS